MSSSRLAASAIGAASLVLISCGSDSSKCSYANQLSCVATPKDGAQDYQYVVSSIKLPATRAEQTEFAFDLDGDGQPDNKLGGTLQILGALPGAMVDLQTPLDESIAAGLSPLLVQLRTKSLTAAEGAGMWTLLGMLESPEACTDPGDLTTCGQHLSGSGMFSLAAGNIADPVMAGDIVDGVFTGGPAEFPISLVLGTETVIVTLIGARGSAQVSADGIMSGKLAGGIPAEEIDSQIVPAVHAMIEELIAEDCPNPVPPDMCCGEGTTGELLLEDLMMDANDDCVVTLQEVQENTYIDGFLATDVALRDANGNYAPDPGGMKDAMSIGVGFTAVPASFPVQGPQ
jgi:hypothetical protein